MKKYLIGTLLIVPYLAAPAHAAPADQWVERYSDEEAQSAYESSQNNTVSTGSSDESEGDGNQTAVVSRRQTGAAVVDSSESNDNSEVSGSNLLPIVGNDILNGTEVASNVLNDYSQHDSSSNPITQTRSEDNDQSSVIQDSFNEGIPVVTLEPRTTRVVHTTEAAGQLPRTGSNFLFPLALGIWLITAGAWLIRRGGGRVSGLAFSG